MFRATISLIMQIFKWLIMVEVKSNNAAAKLLAASPYIQMPIEKHMNTPQTGQRWRGHADGQLTQCM
jgi:hypothetical protein